MSSLRPTFLSDEDLVAACLRGEDRSWNQLVDRYAPYVYAVANQAFGLTGLAAQEVFQDSWIRVYENLASFAGRGQFRSWLRAVVLSAAKDYFRKVQRFEELRDEPSAESEIDELESALDVRSALRSLGDPCAETLRLHFYSGLTQALVAERLKVPAGTVAARLSRCLRRLRAALQESAADGTS